MPIPTPLPRILSDTEAIFGLLAKLPPYAGELDWIPKDERQCAAWSEAYTTLDSAILYSLIHDIDTTFEKPKDWPIDRLYPGWCNKQCAVECLLSGGSVFETVALFYWLGTKHRNRILDFVGPSNDRRQAYWIKKTVKAH